MRRPLIHLGTGEGILSYPNVLSPVLLLKARSQKQWTNAFCRDLLDLQVISWPLLKDTVLAIDCTTTLIRPVFHVVLLHYFPIFCETCYLQLSDASKICGTMTSVFDKLFKQGKEIRRTMMNLKDPAQALPMTKKIIDYSDLKEQVQKLGIEMTGFPEEDMARVKAGFGQAVQKTHQDRTGSPNYLEMTKIVEARNVLQKRIEKFLK